MAASVVSSQELSAVVEVRQGVVGRHFLPKVAFALLLGVSLAGVAITTRTHGAAFPFSLLRWAYLVAAGVVGGSSLWWAAFVREEPEAGNRQHVERFCRREVELYTRVLAAGALGLAAGAPHLWFFVRRGVEVPVAVHGAFLTVVVGIAASLGSCPRHRVKTWNDPRRWVLFAASMGLLVTAGILDAALQAPGNPWVSALRAAHVTAFGLWLGGAAWNLAVAIPAAREDPCVPVVVAAARQLERFRWTVRAALPMLALTGVLQAVPYAGGSLVRLASTSIGQLVLLKAGALAALMVIFVTCPLWRACSPVRGMCDLRDLAVKVPVARTLDNRGKPCAGFVHVHRTLEALGPGEVLELLSTDPISWWELPAWARQNGYEVLDQRVVGRYRILWRTYRFLLRQAGSASTTGGQEAVGV